MCIDYTMSLYMSLLIDLYCSESLQVVAVPVHLTSKFHTRGGSCPWSSLVVSSSGGATQKGLVTGTTSRQTQPTFEHVVIGA